MVVSCFSPCLGSGCDKNKQVSLALLCTNKALQSAAPSPWLPQLHGSSCFQSTGILPADHCGLCFLQVGKSGFDPLHHSYVHGVLGQFSERIYIGHGILQPEL